MQCFGRLPRQEYAEESQAASPVNCRELSHPVAPPKKATHHQWVVEPLRVLMCCITFLSLSKLKMQAPIAPTYITTSKSCFTFMVHAFH